MMAGSERKITNFRVEPVSWYEEVETEYAKPLASSVFALDDPSTLLNINTIIWSAYSRSHNDIAT